ncbi:MAG: ROK family protein [Saprospiraceae bacterium]|nr:ROK family protein [Saprospiraceae bacterium]
MGPLWGIDLGGTKVEGVILEDREHPRVLKRLRIPTEADKGYEHIIQQIVRMVEVLTIEAGIKPGKIGIGTPGALEPSSQLMKNCNTTCLNGMPFMRDLQVALGVPIKMANDANCFALAETHLGAVKDMEGVQTVFGVIMGTGVGGGIVINGEVLSGKQGIAGEWGHTFLDESGGDCYCGKKGCVEAIISGPSLQRYYENLVGSPLSLKEIIEHHQNGGDEVATKTVHRLLHFFGKGLANVINILDPDVIVLGGGLGKIDLLYSDGVWEVEKHVFNGSLETPIVRPKLGDSAGVFGAALL